MKRWTLFVLFFCLSILSLGFVIQNRVVSGQSTAGWTQTYTGSQDEDATSVVQTSDGGYAMAGWVQVSGHYSGNISVGYDFLLVKTDSVGNMLWNKTYGGQGHDEANSMIQTSDGGYAIAGYTESYDTGSFNFKLVKTDSSGNMMWNKTYGDNAMAQCVVQTSDGGYALVGACGSEFTGFWLVKTDSSGNMMWNTTYGKIGPDAYSVIQTSDGGYAIAGSSAVEGNFWLVKTDSSGSMLWNKTYGRAGYQIAYSVIQTVDGGYALAGFTAPIPGVPGSEDVWWVKTDSSGNLQWEQTYGGNGDDWARAVVQTGDGGYAIAGTTGSYGQGYPIGGGVYQHVFSFWLIKIDSSGNMLWSQTYGGTNGALANSIVRTSDGGYALAGNIRTLGPNALYLVKTDARGFIPSSASPSPSSSSSPALSSQNPSPTIPEFPSLMAPLLIALIVFALAICKKTTPKPR